MNAIYTAISDGYDRLKLRPRCSDAHCTAFLTPGSQCPLVAATWDEVRPLSTSDRWYKILSHQAFPDAEYSLWIDGNIVLRPCLFGELIRAYLSTADIALFLHPWAKGVYHEGNIFHRDRSIKCWHVMDECWDAGYQFNGAHYAGGAILRRHTPAVIDFNERWWELFSRWDIPRDQLSLNFLLSELQLPVFSLPGYFDRREGFNEFIWTRHKRMTPDESVLAPRGPTPKQLRRHGRVIGASQIRTQVLQALLNRFEHPSYLEIGIRTGANFNLLWATKKIGVDPTVTMENVLPVTSDSFFAANTERFHVIFVDGDHRFSQVITDIKNAIHALAEGGYIVLHDCLPDSEYEQDASRANEQGVPRDGGAWTGDVWRALLKYSSVLRTTVIEEDHGIGILESGPIDVCFQGDSWKHISFQDYQEHKNEWLRIIPFAHWGPVRLPEPGQTRFFTFIPYAVDKNVGTAMNDFMALLPDDGVGIILDHDALWTTYDWFARIVAHAEKHPDAVLSCMASRMGTKCMVPLGCPPGDDYRAHRAFAETIPADPNNEEGVTGQLLGGVLFVLSKATWKKAGGFRPSGAYWLDFDFYRGCAARQIPVILMKDVYLYHWRRGGGDNSLHLRT